MTRTWVAVAVGSVAVTGLFALGWVADVTWMRILFGIPVLLVFPGGLAAWSMFPADGALDRRNLTGLERGVLSVGLSVVIVALLGLLLEMLGVFEETVFVLSLFLLLALLLVLAVVRSQRLPEAERWPAWAPPRLVPSTILMAVLATGAFASVVAFMASPADPEEYTELGLFGSNDERGCYPAFYDRANATYYATTTDSGNRTIADPDCPVPSEDITILVATHNAGRESFTLSVWWARGDGRSPEAEQAVLSEPFQVSEGDIYSKRLTLPPPPGAGDHFLVVQLYEGTAPAIVAGSPLPEAHREVRLAIDG